MINSKAYQENRKDVLFIDAFNDFYQDNNHNTLLDQRREETLIAYVERKKVEKYTYLATLEELKENNFHLNSAYYIDIYY